MTTEELLGQIWGGCKTDADLEALDRILRAAGVIWTCYCGWNVNHDENRCPNCGRREGEEER